MKINDVISMWTKTIFYDVDNNPNIIDMTPNNWNNYRTDQYKINWGHKSHLPEDIILRIADYFCVDGWKEEKELYDIFGKSKEYNGMSTQFGDIKKYTKPWVDYITFQNSRVIVQFYLDDFNKQLREEKLKRIMNENI